MILLYIKFINIMSINSIKKSIFFSIGSIFLIAGLVFLLIPVLPGFLFAFLGLNILSKGNENIKKNKIINKYLEISNKYMNYIKRTIKSKTKTVVSSIVIAFLILASFSFVAPVEASFGLDTTYKQVKTANSPVVYYLDHKRGKKKAYVSEISYLTYGNKWSDIKIVHPESLRAWDDINLVKSPNRSEVFYIENGTKKWIQTEKDFVNSGFSWNDIVTIAQADLDAYAIVGDNPYPVLENNSSSDTNNTKTSNDNKGVVAVNSAPVSSASNSNNSSAVVNTTSSSNTTTNNLSNIGSSAVNEPVELKVNINRNTQETYIPVNTNNNLLATYHFSASGKRAEIKKLTFNLNGVFNINDISKLYLVTGSSPANKYEAIKLSGNRYTVNFNSHPIVVSANQSQDIKLYADIKGNSSSNNNTFQVSIESSSDIISNINVQGSFPMTSGTYKLMYVENVLGRLEIEELSLERSLEAKIGNVNQELAKFRIAETSTVEDVEIQKIILINNGSISETDVKNFELRSNSGFKVSQAGSMVDNKIVFPLNNYKIQKGKDAYFTVYADIKDGAGESINIQFNSIESKGSEFGYGITSDYTNINEALTIVREALGVISMQLKPSDKVFAEQAGTVIGVYELRNNDKSINLNKIKLTLTKSEFAPNLKDTVYMVNYDTGEMLSYVNPRHDASQEYDFPGVKLGNRESIRIAFVTKIVDSAKQGDRYGTVLNEITYRGDNRVYYNDQVNVAGALVTVSRSNIYIFENQDANAPSYIKGQNDIKIASFYLEAAYGDDVKINSISFAKGNTSGLINYDNGFSNMRAYIGGSHIGTIDRPFSDSYSFSGFSYILKSGQRVEVKILVDTETDLNVSQTELMISRMVAYSNNSGVASVVNGLNTKSYSVNFGEVSASIQALAGGSVNPGENDNLVASFKVRNNGDEAIRLGNISLITSGRGFSKSLGYSNLRILAQDTSRNIGQSNDPVAGGNRLGLSNYEIGANSEKIFEVYVNANNKVPIEKFDLYFSELTARGVNSDIRVDISGLPTSNVIVNDGAQNDTPNVDDEPDINIPNIRLAWPVTGTISATFHDPDYSYRDTAGEHEGIDIAVPQGTEVKAAYDGIVTQVHDGGDTSASYIVIQHCCGVETIYGHMSEMYVQAGDTVTIAQIIGKSGGTPGTSGAGTYTNGPHLHFETHVNNEAVDPMNFCTVNSQG